MTNNLPAPWGDGETPRPAAFDLEKAIDGAVATEARRRRSVETIEAAHAECKQILANKFDELIRLSLPEWLLETLKHEIKPGRTIWGCSCQLTYLDVPVVITRPDDSLNDWRLMSEVFPTEYCRAAHLPQTLMLYLDRIRQAVKDIPLADLPETEGDDDDAIEGVYFA
ncbi:MAG: hypothetical protein SAJ12_08965 [Jaaginema sp. PMC 1079.18]|nr:hypothetical protein [Jaaginema sp. PMC 1080.18]MEC4851131.1 hypothetical protein [Jaaginema sp. PMC 1079.18]MEC4866371.1 hypothetical protein [Jaaginema sp. PMC 1078.18]